MKNSDSWEMGIRQGESNNCPIQNLQTMKQAEQRGNLGENLSWGMELRSHGTWNVQGRTPSKKELHRKRSVGTHKSTDQDMNVRKPPKTWKRTGGIYLRVQHPAHTGLGKPHNSWGIARVLRRLIPSCEK